MKLLLLFLLLIVFPPVFGQSGPYADLLEKYHQSQNFNGAVLVASNGQITYMGAIGEADKQTGAALDVKSKFRIASVTKAFTAVLVMKLVEEGKIDLDQPISKYFPSYIGEGRNNVTVHQLLTYASGIQNELEPLAMQPYLVKSSLDEFINRYCSGPLVLSPGEKSIYGNTEYIILQKIIENVSGKSFEKYLHEIVLNPLGLKNTNVIKNDVKVDGLVDTYTYQDSLNKFVEDVPYFSGNYFAAGSMYSTLEDLLRFSNAIFQHKILKPVTLEKMLTINENLGYTAYGFWGSQGWGTFKEPFYYRTGGILGAGANWIYTTETKKTIIVLSNTNTANLYELSEQLYLLNSDQK